MERYLKDIASELTKIRKALERIAKDNEDFTEWNKEEMSLYSGLDVEIDDEDLNNYIL